MVCRTIPRLAAQLVYVDKFNAKPFHEVFLTNGILFLGTDPDVTNFHRHPLSVQWICPNRVPVEDGTCQNSIFDPIGTWFDSPVRVYPIGSIFFFLST